MRRQNRVITAKRCFCRRPTSRCAPACRRRSRKFWRGGRSSTFTAGCARAARAGRSSCCTTGRPTPTATSTSGTALNKMLKDVVTRSQQMLGFDSNYVPGWDCHGLPIEWKIEEEYRAKGKNKDAVPIIEFRRECRAFAQHWIDVQREEFMRLGVHRRLGSPYYSTMSLSRRGADRARADEVRGQRHALSRLEAGDVVGGGEDGARRSGGRVRGLHQRYGVGEVSGANPSVAMPTGRRRTATCQSLVVIWTTTPWTIPGNRAISYSPKIAYGLYRGHRCAGGQLGEERREIISRRQTGDRGHAASAGDRLSSGCA